VSMLDTTMRVICPFSNIFTIILDNKDASSVVN
jgi:hypothetical protein